MEKVTCLLTYVPNIGMMR